jgi:conjugal transfer pilus assembly protein TraE
MGLFNIGNKKSKSENKEELIDSESNTQNSWQAAIDHSKRMTHMLFLSVAVILVLSLKILTTKPITTATPPNFSEAVTLVGNQASSSYKKQWGIFIAETMGNVSNRNLNLVLEILKPMLSVRDYDLLADQMSSYVKALDIRDQVQTFSTLDVFYDKKFDKVIVYGEMKLTERKKRNTDEENRPVRYTYELTVKSRNGQPRLENVVQYEGAPNMERNRLER